jgi:hypothetical protein
VVRRRDENSKRKKELLLTLRVPYRVASVINESAAPAFWGRLLVVSRAFVGVIFDVLPLSFEMSCSFDRAVAICLLWEGGLRDGFKLSV